MLPEWHSTWSRHYGRPGEDRITPTYGPDGTLVGLMPLVERKGVLRFAGANLGDHFRPVARDGFEGAAAATAAGLLEEARFLVLDHVDQGDKWPEAIRAASQRSLRRITLKHDVLPFIDVAGRSWEEYLGARSRNFRSQVRRKTRKLENEHAATFRRTLRADELDRDFDAFFGLHDARWNARGGSSLSTERSRQFHRDFAGELLELGFLRLWFLELDGKPVAAWYGWCIGGRYAYYLGGFDPEWQELSVGFVLLAHTIRAATEEGAHEYDLLRGDEDYKSRFATGERFVETLALVPAGSPARVLVAAEAAAWRLNRRLPPAVGRVAKWFYSAFKSITVTGASR